MKFSCIYTFLVAAGAGTTHAQFGRGRGGGGAITTSQPPPPPPPPRGATQSIWGQCGGREWAYATACPTSAACWSDNEWYSQCIPLEDLNEKNSLKEDSPYVETHTITTVFNIPGPTASVVTTYITIFTPAPQPQPQPPPQSFTTIITGVPDSPLP